MIYLIKSGSYKLLETKNNTKILLIDDKTFAWVEPKTGEILVLSHKIHQSDCVLAVGHYELYDVIDESTLSDQLHLELEIGRSSWQGYLLPTGFPDNRKHRSRIIPTHEIITGNLRYKLNQHSEGAIHETV